MFLSDVTDRGATPALINVMAFNEARLKMIAQNVANIGTPGYRARHLDRDAFQVSLKEALDARKKDRTKPFSIEGNEQAKTGKDGFLEVTPSELPAQNILFHDGTNASIEREMADLAETGMAHDLAAAMLRTRFDGLRKAIRGTL